VLHSFKKLDVALEPKQKVSFSALLPLAKCAPFNKNTCTLCGPRGITKGCTASFCYDKALQASKRNGVTSKDWCNKRNAEGCGCQWVPQKRPYGPYGQTKATGKDNYGYEGHPYARDVHG
jgi:hypothetical protein